MNTENLYEPAGEFRDRLEAEVLRSFRRAELRAVRLGWGVPSGRWVRAAVIGFVSLAIGTTAGLASAQIRRSAERDSLLAAAKADAMLASLRVDLARAQADDVTRKVRVGLADAQENARANATLRAAETALARRALDIREITASGRAPRDDLNAPLVDGRDFVKERIAADAMAAQDAYAAATRAQQEVERRARAGVDGDIEQLSAAVETARARAVLAVLAEKYKLRQEYIEKNTNIEDLMHRLEKAQLQQDVIVAQRGLALASARLAIAEKRREVGAAGDIPRLRAELDVRERQVELRRLAARLRSMP